MYVVHNHIKNKYSSSLHGVKCLGPALSQSQTVVVNFRLNCSNVFYILRIPCTISSWPVYQKLELKVTITVAHVVIGRCEQSSK